MSSDDRFFRNLCENLIQDKRRAHFLQTGENDEYRTSSSNLGLVIGSDFNTCKANQISLDIQHKNQHSNLFDSSATHEVKQHPINQWNNFESHSTTLNKHLPLNIYYPVTQQIDEELTGKKSVTCYKNLKILNPAYKSMTPNFIPNDHVSANSVSSRSDPNQSVTRRNLNQNTSINASNLTPMESNLNNFKNRFYIDSPIIHQIYSSITRSSALAQSSLPHCANSNPNMNIDPKQMISSYDGVINPTPTQRIDQKGLIEPTKSYILNEHDASKVERLCNLPLHESEYPTQYGRLRLMTKTPLDEYATKNYFLMNNIYSYDSNYNANNSNNFDLKNYDTFYKNPEICGCSNTSFTGDYCNKHNQMIATMNRNSCNCSNCIQFNEANKNRRYIRETVQPKRNIEEVSDAIMSQLQKNYTNLDSHKSSKIIQSKNPYFYAGLSKRPFLMAFNEDCIITIEFAGQLIGSWLCNDNEIFSNVYFQQVLDSWKATNGLLVKSIRPIAYTDRYGMPRYSLKLGILPDYGFSQIIIYIECPFNHVFYNSRQEWCSFQFVGAADIGLLHANDIIIAWPPYIPSNVSAILTDNISYGYYCSMMQNRYNQESFSHDQSSPSNTQSIQNSLSSGLTLSNDNLSNQSNNSNSHLLRCSSDQTDPDQPKSYNPQQIKTNLKDDTGFEKKRPMNAFMHWAKEERLLLIKDYPHTNNRDISKMLGERWKTLSQEKKAVHKRKAKILSEKRLKENPNCWKRKTTYRRKKDES